nr:TPA_inf: chloroplast light-harvesting complex I protein precursor Lhca3 [Mesostigma viride]
MATAALASVSVPAVVCGKPAFAEKKFLGARVAAAARPQASKAAKFVVKAEKSDRQLFFSDKAAQSYLDGSKPGDFGYDPLGLYKPEGAGGFIDPKWLAYSEVIHCRYAMLGMAGMVAPEILGKLGLIPAETGLVWFKTGVIPSEGQYDYWASPLALFWIEVVLMQFAELRRWQDYRHPGSQSKQYFLGLEQFFGGSGDPSYPGGAIFNFLGYGKDEKSMNDLKLKELKNGRLAMVATLGFFIQAMATGEGPFQNLTDHLADPFNNNILTTFGKIGGSF